MYCPQCGNTNPEDAAFCRSCGADLRSYKQEWGQPTGEAGQPADAAVPADQPQPSQADSPQASQTPPPSDPRPADTPPPYQPQYQPGRPAPSGSPANGPR